MERRLRPVRHVLGAALLAVAIVGIQLQRAARVREASLRPVPFRLVTTPVKGHPEIAPFYTVEDLGVVGGHHASRAVTIDAAGQVVCEAYTPSQEDSTPPDAGRTRAFLWSNGQVSDLGTTFGPSSIHASGWMAGATKDGHAALYADGVVSLLFHDPERLASARAVNDAGQIVGRLTAADGRDRAYLWQDGRTQDLGTRSSDDTTAVDINALGEVVGAWSAPEFGGSRACLWRGGRIANLGTLGGHSSWASAINDAGEIVGSSFTVADAEQHACRWRDGVIQDLGTLTGHGDSRTEDINTRGQVVGFSAPRRPPPGPRPANPQLTAFLYTDATGMVDLNTRIDRRSGWKLDFPQSINDAGQIAGTGRHHGRTRAFLLTPSIWAVRRLPRP